MAVHALLWAVRLTGPSGPSFDKAQITLTDLWGDAKSMNTSLAADGLADIRSQTGIWSVAGEAATLVGRHTTAMNAGFRANWYAVEREKGLLIKNTHLINISRFH